MKLDDIVSKFVGGILGSDEMKKTISDLIESHLSEDEVQELIKSAIDESLEEMGRNGIG